MENVKYLVEYWNKKESCWEFKVLDEIHKDIVLSNPDYERVWCKKCTNDVPEYKGVENVPQPLYVLIDYAEGAKVISTGLKSSIEKALEKLGSDPIGRYGILSLDAFNVAFGKMND